MRLAPNLFTCALLLLSSCTSFRKDSSPKAIDSGDKTLVHSACSSAPSQGLDICRVVQGAAISQSWIMILPVRKGLRSGEVRVRYKDQLKTYAINPDTAVFILPWREIIGHDVWELSDEAPAQALAKLEYENFPGLTFVDIMGVAFVVVLKRGYSPMPIDSGAEYFTTDCKIEYSTAGRSAILCSK